uniref:Uncharacterized protein n=1 Tax=Arion vulgaris TaxID=1028688 RepID=A0A0B7B551_9EUPU
MHLMYVRAAGLCQDCFTSSHETMMSILWGVRWHRSGEIIEKLIAVKLEP